MFKVGDTVEWTSQSGGYTKTKTGEVVSVIPAGEWAKDHLDKCKLKGNSSCGFGMPRNHESYLIKIKNNGYYPRVKNLKLLEQNKDNL